MSKKYCYLVISTVFIVFNTVIFLCANTEQLNFWVAWGFANIAILSQLYTCGVAFNDSKTIKEVFMGIPIAYIGVLYFVVQMVISVLLIITSVAYNVALSLCIANTGLFLILFVSAHFGRNIVACVDEEVSKQISFVETLRIEVEKLILGTTEEETQQELQSLLEIVRYSDPKSSSQLKAIEDNILLKIEQINPTGNCLSAIKEVSNLLLQRNVQCKAVKN